MDHAGRWPCRIRLGWTQEAAAIAQVHNNRSRAAAVQKPWSASNLAPSRGRKGAGFTADNERRLMESRPHAEAVRPHPFPQSVFRHA